MQYRLLAFLILSSFGYAQHHYAIDVDWQSEEKPLDITQTITWTNTSQKAVTTLYMLDWNHAYSSERSPLGKFLANEFDYKLIRADKQKRSATHIKTIHYKEGKIQWKRVPEKLDIIEIALPHKVPPNTSFTFTVTYTLQLPDAGTFTFGKSKNELFSQHWHLLLATLHPNGTWILESNVGFGTPTTQEATVAYSFEIPSAYKRILPEPHMQSVSSLLLTKSENYKRIPFGKATLLTDMISGQQMDTDTQEGLQNIYTFLEKHFDFDNDFVYHALQKEYSQKSLLGLESIPQFVGAFDKTQVTTLKLLKAILEQCVQQKYGRQKETSAWLVEGLPYFLWQKFVTEHYPDLKMAGKFSNWPFVKSYHFAQAPYYRTWELAANVSANKNRGQALTTPNNKLTRYNRRIANPSRSALALMHLDAYLGEYLLENTLRKLPKSSRIDSVLKAEILKQTDKPMGWFFDHYVHQDNNGDFSINGKKTSKNSYQITVKSTIDKSVTPLHISLQNGGKQTLWLQEKDMPYVAVYNKNEVASITLNKDHFVPEWSLNNNSFNPNKRIFRNNLRLRLLQDIPKSGTAVLLAAPEFSYNLYDGFLGGISLGNNSILSNRYRFKINPQYGTTSKQINGLGYLNVNRYHENTSHYLTRFTLFGSSYHYAPKNRYTVFSPSIQFFYRPNGIQNNHRAYLNLRHVSVRLQGLDANDVLRSYGVTLASFQSRSGDALKNVLYKTEIQWANPFKKINAEGEYITYYAPNRRWNFRIFGGLFLQNKDNDSYFDFNTSRVNDYLFQYDLYGRSESEGFFSQQYIKAEGGLRTTGTVAGANRWLLTAQTATTLWRWIEGYAEVGWIKNGDQKSHTHWGTGVSFNIIPDFFEIHFPLYDSTGNLMTQHSYAKQIRFQLSLRPSSLARLFSRSWF